MSALLPMTCLCAAAQQGEDNAPAKGDFTVAATLGYNSYTEATALPGNLTDYSAAAFSTDWSKKKLTVGFEAGYFVSDKWKLSLGGGINFTHNPGYADKPGTIDANTPADADGTMGEIPNYRAVASQYSCTYNVAVGVDRYGQERRRVVEPPRRAHHRSGLLRAEGYVCGSIGRSVCLHLQHDFLPSAGRAGTSERRQQQLCYPGSSDGKNRL